jgi:hypothetical protein
MLGARRGGIMSDTDKIIAAILAAAKISKEGTHSPEGYVNEYHKMLAALETIEKAKASQFAAGLEKAIRDRAER